MRIDIVTLFPEIALAPLNESILKRAQNTKLVEIHGHQLRDFATDKHRKTDDYLCGGGPGMLLKPEPFFKAVESLRQEHSCVILMTPQGKPFDQAAAYQIANQQPTAQSHLIILCGHYEGVDHRVVEHLVDQEWSIGDYILTNGAIAAAVFVDAIVRLLPSALGDHRSAHQETFSNGLLEAPAYTKPIHFREHSVPPILLSGNWPKINQWKHQQALNRTRQNRPDLLPPSAKKQTPDPSANSQLKQ